MIHNITLILQESSLRLKERSLLSKEPLLTRGETHNLCSESIVMASSKYWVEDSSSLEVCGSCGGGGDLSEESLVSCWWRFLKIEEVHVKKNGVIKQLKDLSTLDSLERSSLNFLKIRVKTSPYGRKEVWCLTMLLKIT